MAGLAELLQNPQLLQQMLGPRSGQPDIPYPFRAPSDADRTPWYMLAARGIDSPDARAPIDINSLWGPLARPAPPPPQPDVQDINFGLTPAGGFAPLALDEDEIDKRANDIYNRVAPGMGVGQGAGLRNPVDTGPNMRDPLTLQKALSGAMEAKNAARAFIGGGGDQFGYENIGGRNYVVGPRRDVQPLTARQQQLADEMEAKSNYTRQKRHSERAGKPPRTRAEIMAASENLVSKEKARKQIRNMTNMATSKRHQNAAAKKASRLANLGDYLGAITALPESAQNDPVKLAMIDPRLAAVRQRQQFMEQKMAIDKAVAEGQLTRDQAAAAYDRAKAKAAEDPLTAAASAVIANPDSPPDRVAWAVDVLQKAGGGGNPFAAPNQNAGQGPSQLPPRAPGTIWTKPRGTPGQAVTNPFYIGPRPTGNRGVFRWDQHTLNNPPNIRW